jgi:hypothetical protein
VCSWERVDITKNKTSREAEINALRKITETSRTDHTRSPDMRQQCGIELREWAKTE